MSKSIERERAIFLLTRVHVEAVWAFGKLMIVIWDQEGFFIESAAC